MEEEHSKKILQYEQTISNNKQILQRKKKSLRYVLSGIFLFFFALYYFGEEYLYAYCGTRLDYIKDLFYAFIVCSILYTIWLYIFLKNLKATNKKLNEKMYHLMKLKETD